MIVTVTEIDTFLRCRLKWDLSSHNRQSLASALPNEHLGLGLIIHDAMNAWRKDPTEMLVSHYNERVLHFLEEITTVYRERTDKDVTHEQLSPLLDATALGEAMCHNYQAYWKRSTPIGTKLRMSEQQYVIDIPGTPHKVEGRIDALVQDLSGNIWILDHKTYGQKKSRNVIAQTPQFMIYAWMLSRVLEKPVGVIYDGMWKRAEVPKGKDISDLFNRLEIGYPPEQMAWVETFLQSVVTEMASTPAIRPTRTSDGSCVWGCNFDQLCLRTIQGLNPDHEGLYKSERNSHLITDL